MRRRLCKNYRKSKWEYVPLMLMGMGWQGQCRDWVLLVNQGEELRRHVRKRHKCEIYGDKINAHLTSLFNMASSWPFDVLGLDVIGSINLKPSNEHKFILVAIDYFTKWVEASSYMHVTQKGGQRFIKKDFICCCRVALRMITDNA
jgi:hypothetical protein